MTLHFPYGFDAYLIHEGIRYPMGSYRSHDHFAMTIDAVEKGGGYTTDDHAGCGVFIPTRNITRYLMVPRTA